MTSSGKAWLLEGQKEQTLIREQVFYKAFDQSPDFLSHISICRKRFSGLLHNLKKNTWINYMQKADLGEHYLLLHKPGFPRWRHILHYTIQLYIITYMYMYMVLCDLVTSTNDCGERIKLLKSIVIVNWEWSWMKKKLLVYEKTCLFLWVTYLPRQHFCVISRVACELTT